MATALLDPPVVPIDDATRREFLAGLATAGLLTACGASSDETAGPADDGYPRDVVHDGGTTTVPTRPERIVVLGPLSDLEALLSLGVAPVQVGVRSFTEEFLGDPLALWPWLEDALVAAEGEPERVNADDPADPEVVARARPDLIIGLEYWVEEARTQLEQLAPTLVLGSDGPANIAMLGEALDRADEARAVIDAFEDRLAGEVEGLVADGTALAIIRTDGDGNFTVFDRAGYGPVDMMFRAGFAPVPGLPDGRDEFGALSVSLEQLGLLQPARAVVVLGFSPEPTSDLLANPLFTALPAVAADRLLVVEQGPVAQAFAALSPLNLDVVLPVVRRAAALVV